MIAKAEKKNSLAKWFQSYDYNIYMLDISIMSRVQQTFQQSN